MINKPYFLNKEKININIENKNYTGETCDLPFI